MSAAENEQQYEFLSDVVVARQPIYDRRVGVHAYELLFRSNNSTIAEVDHDHATANVISSTFLDIGPENIVDGHYAALNVSEWYLYNAQTLPLPQEKIILEFPTSIGSHQKVLDAIKSLKALGFTIAIDHYEHDKALAPLLPLVDLLKIDIQAHDAAQMPGLVKQLNKFKNLSLLALKVESMEEFNFYREMGFDYSQGFLFNKPKVYSAKSLSSSKLVAMSLLSVLYSQTFDFDETERVVSRDVSISYKLLKLINSPFFGFSTKVDSIQQALVMLGREKLRSWVAVMALSGIDDCPMIFLELTVVRAKMCEELARSAGLEGLESYFTVGLFSSLDILMKQPLEQLLSDLPLSDEISEAILLHEGDMGDALKCVCAYEKADWANFKYRGLSMDVLSNASHKAFLWATKLMQSV